MSPASRFAFADILAVLDALPVGVLMVSPEGRVLHINKALSAMTGFLPDKAEGLPCRHILRGRPCVSGCSLGCGSFGNSGADPVAPGLGLDTLAEAMARPGGSVGAAGFETDILTLKKRRMPVRLTHFPVHDAGGGELFRLDVLEDLTELKHLEQRLHQVHGHGRLVGRSAAMERIGALIPSIAPSTASVLLTGETGTGKDILAECLHRASNRSREPFVRVNISPLPENMLAGEVFGQASPDAPERPGRFQQAAGGTLYIAELADIPKGIQAQLAEFLDTGAITPVGALRGGTPNVRLVAATNREPEHLVERGLLLEELFHRLNVVRLHLPPLRERKEDIGFLLQHFLEMFASRFKKNFTGFSPEAGSLLAAYEYPGNVRELKNIVEYAAMVCSEAVVGLDSLPAHLARFIRPQDERAPRPDGTTGSNTAPGERGRKKRG